MQDNTLAMELDITSKMFKVLAHNVHALLIIIRAAEAVEVCFRPLCVLTGM